MRRGSLVLLALIVIAGALCACSGTHLQKAQLSGATAKSVEREIHVERLLEGSQAQRLGIAPGDVIVEYDGKRVETPAELREAIAAASEPEIKLVIRRGEKLIDMTVQPGKLGVYLKVIARVHRMPDAKVIEGIEPLSWESGELISFVACVRRVLAHYGEQYDYKYLMGISGTAFRIQFFDNWCPSSPDPGCGFDCAEVLLRTLGRGSENYFMKTAFQNMPNALDEAQMRQKTIESIDKGLPVVAIDIVNVPEWGVITGYQNNKQDFFCRSYFDYGMTDYNIVEKTPWIAMTIGEKGESLSGEAAVRQSLAVAYKVGTTETFDGYFAGPAALKAWIAAIENEASFATISAKTPAEDDRCSTNAWIYETFEANRAVASDFLKTYADVFGKMRDATLQLAGIYDKQVELLKSGEENVVLPFAGDMRPWTQELRSKEAATLKEVLTLENEAIELIGTIMEVCEIPPYEDEGGRMKAEG
ncbi:MAG TPA: PDZ domain-containing protein [bacterium]|nr:PDZ domain-containing protein [bacterium]